MVLALYSGSLCNASRKYLELVCLSGYLNGQTNKPSSRLYGSQMETTVTAVDVMSESKRRGQKFMSVYRCLVPPTCCVFLKRTQTFYLQTFCNFLFANFWDFLGCNQHFFFNWQSNCLCFQCRFKTFFA